MYSLPLDSPSALIPSLYRASLQEHWAEFPGLYSIFPLALCFTHGSIYLSVLLSQFIPVLCVCVSILALQVRSHILKLHLFLPLIWLCPINHKVWKLPLLGPFILSPSLIEPKDHDSYFDTSCCTFFHLELTGVCILQFLHASLLFPSCSFLKFPSPTSQQ